VNERSSGSPTVANDSRWAPLALYCETRTGRSHDEDHDRILHDVKLWATGRQSGGRAQEGVSRRRHRVEAKLGRTVRGVQGRRAGLWEVEDRPARTTGRSVATASQRL